MPSREFTLMIDRMRAATAARDARGALTPAALAVVFRDTTLTYQPGDQVIDLVSGQRGVILAGERHTVVVPTGERRNR